MISHPAGLGECDLAMSRRPTACRLGAELLTTLTTLRQIVDQTSGTPMGVSAHGFDNVVAGRQRRRQLPGRHQDGKFHGMIWVYHAEREVVGHGVLVDLAQRPPGRESPRRSTEFDQPLTDIGGQRFPTALLSRPGHCQRGGVLSMRS